LSFPICDDIRAKFPDYHSRVLIGFDGGPSSVSLLHLNHSGFEDASSGARRRLLFTPDVAVIDDGGVFGLSDKERADHVNKVTELARKFNFIVYATSLEYALLEDGKIPLKNVGETQPNPDMTPTAQLTKRLEALFKGMTEQSAKESLLRQMKRRLLIRIAKESEYQKVCTQTVLYNGILNCVFFLGLHIRVVDLFGHNALIWHRHRPRDAAPRRHWLSRRHRQRHRHHPSDARVLPRGCRKL
jgi:hypothetical protein